MVFSSITFVYAFFPLVAVAYYLSKNRVYRNVVLLLASLLFYSWGEPRFLLLMLAATLAAYCGGLLMERSTAHKRLILIVTVVLLVGNLFVFKYLNFFSENLSALFGWRALPKLTLPIGISFYTFQILSYVIDLYRGEIRVQRNYFYLLLYVSFFPQLIAGPIVRYETVEQEILERRESIDDVAAGLRRFILGLAKKVILANNIARIAETIYAGDSAVYGTALYWLAAVAYALQIYFDFSGYSDMAIGIGMLFGFEFPENFNYPYVSGSVSEFWRRWHMTLNRWFVDYLYIPLGGSRRGKWMTVRNKLIVFFCTGLWHGAGWTYILWGLWHGVLVSGEGLLKAPIEKLRQKRGGRIVMHVYTLLAVILGFAMFRASSVQQGFLLIARMFSFAGAGATGLLAAEEILTGARIAALVGGTVLSLPVVPALTRRCTGRGWEIVWNILALLGLLAAILALSGGSFTPFIYQQF